LSITNPTWTGPYISVTCEPCFCVMTPWLKSCKELIRKHVLLHCMEVHVLSTDHELIPTKNASLAAMLGSASGSNVRYYPT
jgi:hypothetical protein